MQQVKEYLSETVSCEVTVKRLKSGKHIFSHVEWHMTGYTLEVAGDGPADFVWADAGALSDRAVPSAFGRYYTEAAARLKEE